MKVAFHSSMNLASDGKHEPNSVQHSLLNHEA